MAAIPHTRNRSTPARPHHPGSHALQRPSVARYWLWAAIAFAVGHFISAAGPAAWATGPAVTLLALSGLVSHRRWAQGALWIGLGLTLGVVLHVVLGIVRDGAA